MAFVEEFNSVGLYFRHENRQPDHGLPRARSKINEIPVRFIEDTERRIAFKSLGERL